MFQSHAWSGVIMTRRSIPGKAGARAPSPCAHDGAPDSADPATTPAAVLRNLRLDFPDSCMTASDLRSWTTIECRWLHRNGPNRILDKGDMRLRGAARCGHGRCG